MCRSDRAADVGGLASGRPAATVAGAATGGAQGRGAPDPGARRRRLGGAHGLDLRIPVHRRRFRHFPAIDRPAGRGEDRPTVVLLDGEVWLHRIGVTATFDNLVAEGRIPPVRVVLPDSLGTDIRWRELTARPDTVDALADVLLPAAGATRGTRAVIAGNSLGGLTAVAATLLRPDRFAHAVAMSPSVWWDPDRSGAPWLLRTARRPIPPDAPPVGIELQVGRQEWVLAGPTRELAPVLARPGRTVNLVEYQGGHDFAWWRGGLADALVRWAGGRARR